MAGVSIGLTPRLEVSSHIEGKRKRKEMEIEAGIGGYQSFALAAGRMRA